ncbi:SDR family oxidoreductase [Ferrimonas marina]|uniref:NAD(P)-dependent dehydrogenase, short-chain alcohol dehydrogenase family n=1 Tax=Ferrimonas marina TaxID=299255 RepID=A0A1M5SB79_9GAMM|nr:SDR family oxidoreductase [Ferrimonas marina]SHH35739.1 NAD(P)-dependent dehydrogenase, short-chain alcohol dehydrogenase family [Ferrimonas marina]
MTQRVLITGANRGIGLAFCHHYLAQGAEVIACCRQPEQAEALLALAESHPHTLSLVGLDLAKPEQLSALCAFVQDQPLDLLISNAGVYGPKGIALGDYQAAPFDEIMQVNVLAPLLLVQALQPHLAPGAKVALLSSKMGSMTDNGSGGAYFYRASKAAVNAIGRSLAVDLAPQQVAVALLHPGWVKTEMGGAHALIDTDTSVQGMSQVIAELNLERSGQFYNYDGQTIGW